MTFIEALILGIIQGITEFLPVSSSGHLVLLQRIMGFNEPALIFDVMVHVGTLAAVITVLWHEILFILKKPFQSLTLYLIIATLPVVAAALFFNNFVERAFESGAFLGFCFLITSALLLLAEFLSQRAAKIQLKDKMTWADALIIGVFQAIAIIPGISRSGSTISGALMRRLNRELAARFSFLLSIPAILGAFVFELRSFIKAEISGNIDTIPLIIGTVSATIVGFFAIKFMLKIIKEHSLVGFSIYTGVLGILVLADKFGTHFFF